MAEGEKAQDKGHLGRILAIVAGAVGVATLGLGVLTYLQSQPSSVAAHAKQVSEVCQSAKVRQVPLVSALDSSGGYSDHEAFINYVTNQVAADRQTVQEFKRLKAPAEVADQSTEASRLGDAWIAEDETYLASLAGLKAAEWGKKWPRLPGESSSMTQANQQFFAALERLSGGTCTTAAR